MKNRNDAGNVHFDASTDCAYVDRKISFEHKGNKWEMELRIPMSILDVVKQEHFDRAIAQAKREMDNGLVILVMQGVFDSDILRARIADRGRVALLTDLYNEFLLEQNRRGNAVWAVPQQIVDVGPDPLDDPKYVH